MNNIGVTITPEQVREWEAQAEELQRKISAARVFLPPESSIAKLQRVAGRSPETNFMGTIARIANDAPKPISKAELKEILRNKGFPDEQVGSSYLYVAIKKLKDKKRISVQPDGSVWKGTRT